MADQYGSSYPIAGSSYTSRHTTSGPVSNSSFWEPRRYRDNSAVMLASYDQDQYNNSSSPGNSRSASLESIHLDYESNDHFPSSSSPTYDFYQLPSSQKARNSFTSSNATVPNTQFPSADLPGNSYTSSNAPVPNVRCTPSSLRLLNADYPTFYRFMVPRKGGEPYFELFDKWTPTSEMPAKVYLDEPRYACNFSWTSQLIIINREVKKKKFPCMYPSSTCRRKEAFSIAADLERHYITAHAYNQDSFPCDYRNCPRAIEPFRRKDHYREHLRGYHKEDLGTFSGTRI